MTDNITHSLFAFLIGIILIKKLKFEDTKWPIVALILAANFPDIDFVIRFFGTGFYLVHHREFSHCIIGIILLSLIIAAVFSKLKQKNFNKYFLLGLAGTTSHIFLDIITSWGTQVLYPFNHIRYQFSLISIVDIYVLAIFIVAIVLIYMNRDMDKGQAEKIAKAALFIFIVLLLFKAGLKIYADNAVARLNGYDDVSVIPSMSSPFKWRAIINDTDIYIVNDFDVSTTGFGAFQFYPKEDNPLIEKSKSSLVVEQFREFAQFPYSTVKNNTVEWFDLRLSSDGSGGFVAKVEFDDSGNIVSGWFGAGL